MITFWYPADPPPAEAVLAAWLDDRFAADSNWEAALAAWGASGADALWTKVFPRLVSHRYCGAPLASGAAKCPVVIHSHGLSGTRQLSSQIAEELASHGYVVVAMDHTDCWGTEFPDGRYLIGATRGDVSGRLKDVQFLVDQLAQLNSRDALFSGRLDLDRIGVYGMSMGGAVVESCRSDSRLKCAAIWDATNLKLNSAGLQKPFLAALGQNNLFYSENQWLFSKATTDAVLLLIRSAEHVTGCDAAWTWEIPWGQGPALAFDACLVWFFDTYLKGQTPPFPTNSEIFNVQRK